MGDTKVISVGGTNYTVRVANISNYNFSFPSKTVCGFVFEFVDIVKKREMNASYTSIGGWPITEVRSYLNGDFYGKLPSDLQNVIINTIVVSEHPSTDTKNFTSTDKLYLLSPAEVWMDKAIYDVLGYDTPYMSTRQLDYYNNKNVTTSNYSDAIK